MTLDDLRKIAENATKGPWKVETDEIGTDFGDDIAYGIKNVAPVTFYSDSDMAHLALDPLTPEDAEFIATFNPQKVLELLAQIERLEGVIREQARVLDGRYARLTAVEKLHQPLTDPGLNKPHCAGCETGATFRYWPCDTIKAARGE